VAAQEVSSCQGTTGAPQSVTGHALLTVTLWLWHRQCDRIYKADPVFFSNQCFGFQGLPYQFNMPSLWDALALGIFAQ